MKNLSRHKGVLQILGRLPNSANGNPRYRAFVGGVNFVTAPDSAFAYELPNYDGKEVSVLIGTYYGKATLHSIEAF